MATATKATVEIPQPPIIPPPIKKERIVLELSINEAETLGLLLARTSGSPDGKSRRGHCDSMRIGLEKVGYGWVNITKRLGYDLYTFAPAISAGFVNFNNEKLDPSKD